MKNPLNIKFWDSVKGAIPFTAEYKRSTAAVREIEDFNLVNEEIKRAKYIKSLIDQGMYQDALTELKNDTDELNYSQFYRLRKRRSRGLSEGERERNFLYKLSKKKPEPPLKCKWTLSSLDGRYYCTNDSVLRHTHCHYHLKYCVDSDSKHDKNHPVQIQSANSLGLCSECFICKEKCYPRPIRFNRIPGVRRIINDDDTL